MTERKIVISFIILWLLAGAIASIGIRDALLSDEFEFIFAAHQVVDWNSFSQVMTSKIGGDFYRPVLYFSFMVDYTIYGLNSWGYHLTNSILQATNTLLVTLLVWVFGHLYYLREDKSAQKKKQIFFVSFVAGLLFAVFPSHHEAVTWVAARTDLLAVTFYLFTLLLWLLYTKKFFTNFSEKTGHNFSKKIIFVILISLTAVGAFFTKEVSVSLIFLLLILLLWHGGWYFNKKYKYWLWLILSWLPVVAIFIAYILIRKMVVGYWFGGYVQNGSSVFLNINPQSLWLYLKVPLAIAVYTFNYAYWFEISRNWFWPFLAQPFRLITILVHVLEILMIAVAVLLSVYRNKIKQNFLLAVIPVVALYAFASPMIGVLRSLDINLESARFFYLPSVAFCILIALWLSLFKSYWKYVLSAILSVGFLSIYIFNYVPWHLASNSSRSIQKAIITQKQNLNENDWVYIFNAPDNVFGGFVFRRGLTQMFQLYVPAIDRNKVIISGRGQNGTFAPQCLADTSEFFWLMNLDDQTGLVKTFESTALSIKPREDLVLADYELQFKDIKKINADQFEVIGAFPEIVVSGLNIDPQTISNIIFTLSPETDQPWAQFHIYWTTESRPFYHEYYRQIWRSYVIKAGDTESQKIIIPVCSYPSFVFSDRLQNMRIVLPFKPREEFNLQ